MTAMGAAVEHNVGALEQHPGCISFAVGSLSIAATATPSPQAAGRRPPLRPRVTASAGAEGRRARPDRARRAASATGARGWRSVIAGRRNGDAGTARAASAAYGPHPPGIASGGHWCLGLLSHAEFIGVARVDGVGLEGHRVRSTLIALSLCSSSVGSHGDVVRRGTIQREDPSCRGARQNWRGRDSLRASTEDALQFARLEWLRHYGDTTHKRCSRPQAWETLWKKHVRPPSYFDLRGVARSVKGRPRVLQALRTRQSPPNAKTHLCLNWGWKDRSLLHI